MQNMLQNGMAWLACQQRDHFSSPVSLIRGANTSSVLASRSREDVDVEDGNGALTREETWIWIIHRSEYQFGGVPTQPAKRDRIETGGDVFEVLPVGGRSHWSWTDGSCNAYRVVTKKKESTDA